jgi:hypothetical protein
MWPELRQNPAQNRSMAETSATEFRANVHLKVLAVFALVNGCATIAIAVTSLGGVPLYGGEGIVLVIVLVLLLALLGLIIAWFASAVYLWRAKRVGLLLFWPLAGLNLSATLAVLVARIIGYESFARNAGMYGPAPYQQMMDYLDGTIIVGLVVLVYLAGMAYAFTFARRELP